MITVMLCLLWATHAQAQDQQQRQHVIQPGETLYSIAMRYGVSIEAIASANNVVNTWRIYSGQTLIIPPRVPAQPLTAPPDPPAQESAPAEPAQAAPEPERITHIVANGESLGRIAERYNMSINALASLNNISNPNLIYRGQELVIIPGSGIPEAPLNTVDERGRFYSSVTHLVQPGETLESISSHYSIAPTQIMQANQLAADALITVGEPLIIPGAAPLPGVDYSFVTAPNAPEARIGRGREVIVDLSDQRIYAYLDGVLVRSVIVSTGLPATPTVQGNFTVQRKYSAQTMSGPGYHLPGVPWVVYFYAGYALHGTYWHDNFGQPMSHGCVNLPTPEAAWFYNFVQIGTPIHVRQ
jgi:LysM repeat protein